MAEACTFARIALLVARTQPNVLHAVTIKPVIYGGLAARLLGVGGVLYAITGLRYQANCATEATIMKRIMAFLTKLALSHRNSRVIFQNITDLEEFVNNSLCSPRFRRADTWFWGRYRTRMPSEDDR